MERQEKIERSVRQLNLAVVAHEDVPLGDVRRVLLVQTPAFNAGAGVPREEVGRAVGVIVACGRDVLVIFRDELCHLGELCSCLELIPAVGDIVSAVELGVDRKRQLRAGGKGLRGDACTLIFLRAAGNDDDQHNGQKHHCAEQNQHSLPLPSSSFHRDSSIRTSKLSVG